MPRNWKMNPKRKIIKKLQDANVSFPLVRSVEKHVPASPMDTSQLSDLKATFIEAAEKLSCTIHVLDDKDSLASILSGIITAGEKVSAWDWDQIPLPDANQIIGDLDLQLTQSNDPAAQFGITGALVALAATGSLVIDRRRDKPTAPSLLPPVHIAIIEENQILPNLEAWIAKQRSSKLNDFRSAGNIMIVTGPSRTADIGMELILGMHGPKELHIIILPDN